MSLIILSIYFWYIAVPAIIVLISGFSINSHQKRTKLCNTLDKPEKQEEFTKETGNLPIKNGKFTKEYKSWLIQKENEKILLSQQQSTVQSQSTYQTAPISQPPPVYQPQPTYQPISKQEKSIEKPISDFFVPKAFKVKFKDFTPNEKVIRVISESIGIILLIIFIILAILSFVDQFYLKGLIYILIMGILIIPIDIIEHKLRKNVRTRKQKEFTEKYLSFKTAQPQPTYQPLPEQATKVEKIICPFCGIDNLKTSQYCKECGSRLE